MNEKLHSKEPVKSTESGSEKKSEKDYKKNLIRDIGFLATILVIGVGGLAGAQYYEENSKGPEVLFDENRVEYVIESGDTLEDLVKNVNKEIFLEKTIVLDREEKAQLDKMIEDESNSKGIIPGKEVDTDITRFENSNGHIRSVFDVQINDASKDAE
jgi:hypothetical protein